MSEVEDTITTKPLRWHRLDFDKRDILPKRGQPVLAFPAMLGRKPCVLFFALFEEFVNWEPYSRKAYWWDFGRNRIWEAKEGDWWMEIPSIPEEEVSLKGKK